MIITSVKVHDSIILVVVTVEVRLIGIILSRAKIRIIMTKVSIVCVEADMVFKVLAMVVIVVVVAFVQNM